MAQQTISDKEMAAIFSNIADSIASVISPIKSPKRPRDLDSPDFVQVIQTHNQPSKSQKQIRLRAPKPSGNDTSRWKPDEPNENGP